MKSSSMKRKDQEVEYHVSHRARVDVGVMNAAVFFIGILPVCWTFVMFTKPPSCFSVHDGAKHKDTRAVETSSDQLKPVQTSSDQF